MFSGPAADNDLLVVEGLLTTLDEQSRPHVAAMGPVVDRELTTFVLRPYESSQTYRHLRATGEAVFHITDDLLLLARVIAGELSTFPAHQIAEQVQGVILDSCCRWYALRVDNWEGTSPRWVAHARVIDRGERRPFFGLNRSMYAVVEAAILASRVGILPASEILDQLKKLRPLVEKTAGVREREAFAIVGRVILARLCSEPAASAASDHGAVN